MAIDLNNRNNPTDPDAIYSMDTSHPLAGWVKDKDWSIIYPDEKSAKAAGANNKISTGTLITNDGRKFDFVIGADGTPISVTGDATGQDDDVAGKWKANAPARAPGRTPEGQQIEATNAKNAAELQRQREKNAALPASQDPAYETDKERRDRSDARIKEQGAAATAAATQANVDADNRRADQTAATSAATAAQNSATAAAREKREQEAAGRIQDPTTKQWLEKGPDNVWRPVKTEGVPTGAEPAGAPQPSGRLGEAAADMAAYEQWLAPQVRSGKMTLDQADKRREARRQFWETAIKEQQGVVNAQQAGFNSQNTQRSATMADLSNRRSAAGAIATSDPNGLTGLATKLGGGAHPAAGLSEAIRNSRVDAQNFVTMSGANRMVPEIQTPPAVSTVMGMGLPYGSSSMPGLDVRPNPIGAGAIGSIAPSGAQVAAQTQQVTGDTQRAIAPLLAPQAASAAPSAQQAAPVVQGQARATVPAQAAQATPALPATPDSDPLLNVRNKRTGEVKQVRLSQINNASDKADFEVLDPNNTGTVQPGGDAQIPAASPTPSDGTPSAPATQTPVDVPYPSNAGAESLAPTQAPPYFLAGSSRGHQHDPTQSIQEMIADPNMDNNAVRQAVAEMFPGYPIDQLLAGRAA